jgi:hypothetical protein
MQIFNSLSLAQIFKLTDSWSGEPISLCKIENSRFVKWLEQKFYVLAVISRLQFNRLVFLRNFIHTFLDDCLFLGIFFHNGRNPFRFGVHTGECKPVSVSFSCIDIWEAFSDSDWCLWHVRIIPSWSLNDHWVTHYKWQLLRVKLRWLV